MKGIMKRALVVAVLLGLMFEGSASAAVKTFSTSLSLHANRTTINAGQNVVFTGRLRSERSRCEKFKTVTLFRGKTPVASRKTNEDGEFTFRVNPTSTAFWRVKFSGFRFGTHPNIKLCKPSASRRIKVRVRS